MKEAFEFIDGKENLFTDSQSGFTHSAVENLMIEYAKEVLDEFQRIRITRLFRNPGEFERWFKQFKNSLK